MAQGEKRGEALTVRSNCVVWVLASLQMLHWGAKRPIWIPLLDIYPKDAQSYHKDMWSAMFTAALFVIARTRKQPKWTKKMWYIYTIQYYTVEKKIMAS